MSEIQNSAAAVPDPSSIIRLSTAYWDSQTLLTANRLRIFDLLADGPQSADELAATMQLDPRGTALFLRACVALGFLAEHLGRFENTPTANTYLVSRSPAYMGNVIRYSDQLYPTWGGPRGSIALRQTGSAGRDLPWQRSGTNTRLRPGHA